MARPVIALRDLLVIVVAAVLLLLLAYYGGAWVSQSPRDTGQACGVAFFSNPCGSVFRWW